MPRTPRTNMPVKGGPRGFQPKDIPLVEEEHHQIARWLGEFIPPGRIPEMVQQRFGKTLDKTYAFSFQKKRKWGLLIDRYRQEWIVKVSDVPLAHKKFRLEKLTQLLESLEFQHQRQTLNPQQFERRVLKILESARLEMEERTRGEQTNYFFTAINQASDEELLQRRSELLKRIQEFRWPKVRRVPDGMGRSEGGATTPGTNTGDDGGGGAIRDLPDDGAVAGPPAEG